MERPLALRYLSEAWAEEALRRVEQSPEIRKAVKGIDLSLLTIILDPPEEAYGFIYAAFDGEGLTEYRVGKDYSAIADGVPAPTFAVSGSYETFSAMQRGELGERRALLTGKLHLTGSMLKALRHMRAMETVSEVLRSIECDT